MIVKNIEFFGYDIETSGDLMSINIMVNPERIELKSYRKTPFASLIIKNQMLVDKYNELLNEGVDMTHNQWITAKIELYFSQNTFERFNMFLDSTKYDNLRDKFKNRLFHTMIYYKDLLLDPDEYESNYSVMMLAAFPVNGIISPISKSTHYQLYNGCLIHCKPFKHNNESYNKILYVLVDIRTYFSYQEFIPGNVVGHMLNTTYSVDYFTKDCMSLTKNGMKTSLLMQGYAEFFSKPCKNIFRLSDIPKDILTRSESFSLKM